MIKILFVCLGNICRSPMAQFGFKQMVEERDLSDRFEIDSAATESYNEMCHANKIHRLLDFTDHPRNIRDPWYTGNFDESYRDIHEGCQAFLEYLATILFYK